MTNDGLFYVLSPVLWASWTYTVLSYFCPSEDSAIWLPCYIACQWCCTLIIQIEVSPLQLEPKALPIQGRHIIDTLTLVLTYQQGYKQDLIKTSLRSFNTVNIVRSFTCMVCLACANEPWELTIVEQVFSVFHRDVLEWPIRITTILLITCILGDSNDVNYGQNRFIMIQNERGSGAVTLREVVWISEILSC